MLVGPGRPGIVHRLDKDTTGVMVLAKTVRGYRSLSEQFASRRVAKDYLALAYGHVTDDAWTEESPIGRHKTDRTRMAVRSDGRQAVTHFRVEDRIHTLCKLSIVIETGRTHQIRVHAKQCGAPLIGDPVYGEARWKSMPRKLQKPLRDFARPALHAATLAFDDPANGSRITVESEPPEDLSNLWNQLRVLSQSGPR